MTTWLWIFAIVVALIVSPLIYISMSFWIEAIAKRHRKTRFIDLFEDRK
jgi:hypothetical protein